MGFQSSQIINLVGKMVTLGWAYRRSLINLEMVGKCCLPTGHQRPLLASYCSFAVCCELYLMCKERVIHQTGCTRLYPVLRVSCVFDSLLQGRNKVIFPYIGILTGQTSITDLSFHLDRLDLFMCCLLKCNVYGIIIEYYKHLSVH